MGVMISHTIGQVQPSHHILSLCMFMHGKECQHWRQLIDSYHCDNNINKIAAVLWTLCICFPSLIYIQYVSWSKTALCNLLTGTVTLHIISQTLGLTEDLVEASATVLPLLQSMSFSMFVHLHFAVLWLLKTYPVSVLLLKSAEAATETNLGRHNEPQENTARFHLALDTAISACFMLWWSHP